MEIRERHFVPNLTYNHRFVFPTKFPAKQKAGT